jgi:hypothetical protein
MMGGSVMNPHTLARRYLMAGKRLGLPKEWGQRLATWLQRTVDAIWLDEPTPTDRLALRAMDLEHRDNCAEKRHDLERSAASLRARIETQQDEVAADQVLLAKMERDLTALEGAR